MLLWQKHLKMIKETSFIDAKTSMPSIGDPEVLFNNLLTIGMMNL